LVEGGQTRHWKKPSLWIKQVAGMTPLGLNADPRGPVLAAWSPGVKQPVATPRRGFDTRNIGRKSPWGRQARPSIKHVVDDKTSSGTRVRVRGRPNIKNRAQVRFPHRGLGSAP
jgi:hypothetical protein